MINLIAAAMIVILYILAVTLIPTTILTPIFVFIGIMTSVIGIAVIVGFLLEDFYDV